MPSQFAVCHPTSGEFHAHSIIAHRAALHQRTCLLRMVQQNKNTLEFGETSGCEDLIVITHLSECYHLKCLNVHLSRDVSESATIISDVCKLLEHKIKPLLTTSPTTTSVDDTQQHHVVPLEELELPLPMLYSLTHLELVEKLHRLLTSPEIASSLRRLVISNIIRPRTFDNIIAKLTGLTSLSITLEAQTSFDASEAMAKLVNLRNLEVGFPSILINNCENDHPLMLFNHRSVLKKHLKRKWMMMVMYHQRYHMVLIYGIYLPLLH
jgi:hypothetical protein